jgi:hypothetical protein
VDKDFEDVLDALDEGSTTRGGGPIEVSLDAKPIEAEVGGWGAFSLKAPKYIFDVAVEKKVTPLPFGRDVTWGDVDAALRRLGATRLTWQRDSRNAIEVSCALVRYDSNRFGIKGL